MAKKLNTLLLNGNQVQSLFYYYDNWRANQKNLIHKGHCGDCQFGFGKRGKQIRGEQGVWIGPFDTIDLVEDFVKRRLLKPSPEKHSCCEEIISPVA
jgi:hypothetical protein